jgi:cell division septum initiation protein DivIVA
MNTDTDNLHQLIEAFEALREEVSSLRQRVEQVESATASATQMSDEAQREELVATISAAIAAYLGFKPHIRQIRLIGGAKWSQQGRASIQASHELSIQDR